MRRLNCRIDEPAVFYARATGLRPARFPCGAFDKVGSMDKVTRRIPAVAPLQRALMLLVVWLMPACGAVAGGGGDGSGEGHGGGDGRDCYPVSRVVDGDTFRIQRSVDEEDIVRMVGVDTPETVKPNAPVEAYGREASDFAKSLLRDRTVCLEYDVQTRDRYGRLLAYVYLEDGTFVNETLIAEGYAQAMTVPPNVRFAESFASLQREARDAGLGLWSGAAANIPEASGDGDPEGPDRDCGDFADQEQAQAFFEAAGGPESDRHRLDGDLDGIACESLP